MTRLLDFSQFLIPDGNQFATIMALRRILRIRLLIETLELSIRFRPKTFRIPFGIPQYF